MQIFLATLIFFGLAMAIMAVGVLFGSRPLKGSCGGEDRDCTCSAIERARCRLGAGGEE